MVMCGLAAGIRAFVDVSASFITPQLSVAALSISTPLPQVAQTLNQDMRDTATKSQ